MQPHQFNWLEEELVINIQPSVVALFSLLADVLVLCHEHLVRVRHGPIIIMLGSITCCALHALPSLRAVIACSACVSASSCGLAPPLLRSLFFIAGF